MSPVMLDGPQGPHFEKHIPPTDSTPTLSSVNPVRSNFDMQVFYPAQTLSEPRSEMRESVYFGSGITRTDGSGVAGLPVR